MSGLLADTVSQRTREIGIRMARGAEPGFVRRLVLRQGLTLVITGLVIGIVASLALGRLMSSLMYGTSSVDPATYLVVTLVLLIASLGACWGPATRASRLSQRCAKDHMTHRH
ncbi:MAG: FtsX-like permease family protein [Lysobacter sp.]|nr:FtsX-like permease family protein [Lysobacter sp.]